MKTSMSQYYKYYVYAGPGYIKYFDNLSDAEQFAEDVNSKVEKDIGTFDNFCSAIRLEQ